MNRSTKVTAEGAETKSAQITEYMVLEAVEATHPEQTVWMEVGKTKAVNATQAIRNLVDDDEPRSTHVAVPARSWRPVKPTVKVERRVSWS